MPPYKLKFKLKFFFSEQSNNSNNDSENGHEDNLDVVSLVGEDDLEEHQLKDEHDDEDDELAEKPEEEYLRRQKESREFEDEKARENESKSPVANGFVSPPTQPFFNHAFAAAAFAAGAKSPFDAILPPLPSSALTPHEYLARYYQFMQQQQSQNAAAALSAAAAAQAANSAKMGSPVLHRNYDSGIEQQTN